LEDKRRGSGQASQRSAVATQPLSTEEREELEFLRKEHVRLQLITGSNNGGEETKRGDKKKRKNSNESSVRGHSCLKIVVEWIWV